MKRTILIVSAIELMNWYIEWPLTWQIVFTIFGFFLILMVYAVKTSEPDPDQPKPPKFYESTFFHDN